MICEREIILLIGRMGFELAKLKKTIRDTNTDGLGFIHMCGMAMFLAGQRRLIQRKYEQDGEK